MSIVCSIQVSDAKPESFESTQRNARSLIETTFAILNRMLLLYMSINDRAASQTVWDCWEKSSTGHVECPQSPWEPSDHFSIEESLALGQANYKMMLGALV